MIRFFITAFISLSLIINLHGQVYHYKTGKVIPVNVHDQITWKKGIFNNIPADYGILVTKENRNSKNSRLINIPIIRIKSLSDSVINNPVFILNGGPGESNLKARLLFEKLLKQHDIVLIGFRGIDGSVNLDCNCYKNALLNDTLTFNNAERIFNTAYDSCLNIWKSKHIDISGYSMDEVIQDIEITRKNLNYNKIDFLAFSYGTMLSQLYFKNYPQNVNRMVLIGARPLNNYLLSGTNIKNQIEKIYVNFNQNHFKHDSITTIINNISKTLNNICNRYSLFNKYRLFFMSLSKLYSTDEIKKNINIYKKAASGNNKELKVLYDDFYNNFPKNIVSGDFILKKQNKVNFIFENNYKTFEDSIANSINYWYSPEISLLKFKTTFPSTIYDTVNVMFISGEFDIVAPSELIKNSNCFKNYNTTTVIIKNAGHLDLFYSKLPEVKQNVIQYLNKQ